MTHALHTPSGRGLTWTSESDALLRVHSAHASQISVCILDAVDPDWVQREVPLERTGDEWVASIPDLAPGSRYALRADGNRSTFDPQVLLLDPYARAVGHYGHGWQSVALAPSTFDWQGVERPDVPRDRRVIYEAHARGLTAACPEVPAEIRGSYAALAHPAVIEHLTGLGVTTLELLPIHAFATERRLRALGLTNYWGYNSLAFFAPHPRYGSPQAQSAGPQAIVTELKTAIRELHRAGIQVVLDVVYNHTAEGRSDPTLHFRGLDDDLYYRKDAAGRYVDTTGCGNTLNCGELAVQQLIMDSLRYWVQEYRVDGFRFDLAATLGRGTDGAFHRDHPLLTAIGDDPVLSESLIIAEPWDVGIGGWQSGGFPPPWSEWNDHFRDTARTFWLSDTAAERRNGQVRGSVGKLADALAGSAALIGSERGPLNSINFITAHDGFTLADVVSYTSKHNLGNGEGNRDGTENNHSFNFGVEGPSSDPEVLDTRDRAARNLMATLLFSAGTPMFTAGDELLRSQQGNNNAYCHDSTLTWLDWSVDERRQRFRDTVARLIQLRRDNSSLRPIRYGSTDERVPSASVLHWFNAQGTQMTHDEWNQSGMRTIQLFSRSTPEVEDLNRTLVVIHGTEQDTRITLPEVDGVAEYTLLWDSAWTSPAAAPSAEVTGHPGRALDVSGMSVLLFRAN